MIDKELVATLTAVGFDNKEARVYLALIELGPSQVSQIATRAELKRPIVYYVLDHLKQRGYVQEVASGKVKHFSAADPSRLLAATQTATEELRFMLPLIHALQNKGKEKPRIEYFQGLEPILSIYGQLDKEKDVRFITSIQKLTPVMAKEIELWARHYESKRKDGRAHRVLVSDHPTDVAWAKRVSKGSAEVRILPKGQETDMDFSLSKDMLCITSFDPLFIVVIHSEKVARSAALLFDLAWESARKIEAKKK